MEFKKIKIAGCDNSMIFIGEKYIFWNDWYGVIGLATRKGYDEESKHTFVIKAGTENTVGGRINRNSIIAAMKKYISKSENKYILHTTLFEDSGEICNCGVDIHIVDYSQNN